jgi:hypothetical protein
MPRGENVTRKKGKRPNSPKIGEDGSGRGSIMRRGEIDTRTENGKEDEELHGRARNATHLITQAAGMA